MRSEIEHHLLLSFSKNHRIGQCRQARADLDRATSSVIHDAIFETPAVGIPCPARNRVVDQGSPEESPDEEGHETTTFGDGARNDSSCDGAELHLS